LGRNLMTSNKLRQVRHALTTVCVYLALYVALDQISLVQPFPILGFTLWNLTPACSLALLVIKGLQFAPALLAAGILADFLDGGFAPGVLPTLMTDLIPAVGYSAVAGTLQAFVHPVSRLQSVRDIALFLGVTGAGVLAIAGLLGGAFALMNVLPADQLLASMRHFFIGDLSGIVCLFPVMMTAPAAWVRVKQLSALALWTDVGGFTLALAGALWVVFGLSGDKAFQFFYLLLLPVIWIGVRHGLPCCALAVLIEQSALVATIALNGYGTSLFISFQMLSLAIAVTGLVLGAVVTERQRAELGLRQRQAELGRMARLTTAGALGTAIIHEISQPLATIATYAHACRRILSSAPERQELLAGTLVKVESEALRAGEIVERLRDFLSKGQALSFGLNLEEVTRWVVAALADEARLRDVNVHLEAETVPLIVADRVQVEQVLVNLIRNGIEAAESAVKDKQVWVRLRLSGAGVQIVVEDSGPGVAAEIAERLFEPFTTNKPRGMGLGLMLSREIIESLGGSLWCDHWGANGSRFAFWLPRIGSNTNAK
jgi:two-component system sensor kinase FixL